MSAEQQSEIARRTQVCSAVEAHIMTSISRHAGPTLDEVDEAMYQDAMKPLLSAMWRGVVQADAPEVWQLIFAIRGAERRPSAEQVTGMVRKALGLAEPSSPMEARNVVKAPLPPSQQLPSKDGPPGAWMEHLTPSGNADRDAFLVDLMAKTERAMGSNHAVVCARVLVDSRERLKVEREQHRKGKLEAIPEDDRDEYLRRAGGDVDRAVRLYVARQRERHGQEHLARWRQRWQGHSADAAGGRA